MKRIRRWFIKEGLLNPKDIKETRELFSFPVELKKQKPNYIWMTNHLERIA